METLCPAARGSVDTLDLYNFIQNNILSRTQSSLYWLPRKFLDGDFGFV